MYLIISLLCAFYGYIAEDAASICIGGIIYFFIYPIDQYMRKGISSVTPVSLFSLIKGMASLSNLVGLILIENPASRAIYFKYISIDHLVTAMLIHYLGTLMIIAGFEASIKNKQGSFPELSYYLSKKQISFNLVFIVIIIFIMIFFNLTPSLGSLTNLIKFIPTASIFFFCRYGASRNDDKYIKIGFFFMLAATFHAVLYSYLRMQIVLPGVAFILGLVIGQKSLSALKKPITYPIYFGAFVFISYFTFLGNSRTELGSGWDRIEAAQTLAAELEEEGEEEKSTFLSRFSNMNQLSQIGRIAEEDGFYYGETMSYLVFGFIPRIIWPEKPIIQQGAWFAYRIGKARIVNGMYTNSIDMSSTGELYLNFGWLGVLIGGFLFGAFFGKTWLTTNFWTSENNILGSLFGFYLLYLGLFSFGADLQILITVIAMYLIFYILNKILGHGISNRAT